MNEYNDFVSENESDSQTIHKGDIYLANLDPVIGSEQNGTRPILILQNNIGNRFSPTVIAAAMTSKVGKKFIPTHVLVDSEKTGLDEDSIVLLEQIRTIDRRRLIKHKGRLGIDDMKRIDAALKISLDLE